MTTKQIILTGLTITIVALIVWGFLPSSVPVRVAGAEIAPLEVVIEEEGITRVTDRYVISAPVTGYALRMPYEVGDSVTAGQTLVHILPMPDLISARQRQVADAQLEAAKARRQQAKEQLELAKEEKRVADVELRRLQDLYASDIGSAQGVEQATLAARRAAAQQASAAFTLSVAEQEVRAAASGVQAFQASGREEEITIASPVPGRVLKIYQKSEGTVSMGLPLLEIGDPRSLEVKIDLLSSDAVQVKPGTPVRIKRWGSETILDGVVRVVEPSGFTRISALGVEEQRVPVIVDITTPHEQWLQLGDGYRVVVEFILWDDDSILQVPSSALFRTDREQWSLFVMEGGRARLRPVEAGKQSGLQTQILTGLKAGETVISHPDERIEEGVRVKRSN